VAALVSVLIFTALSLLVTHVATVALTLTGLSRQLAQFQARSAFSGVGFTTTEAEKVVNHPVRRRIIMLLMLLGNAGIVTVISSLILTFVAANTLADWVWRLILLVAGLGMLWYVGTSGWVDRHLSRLISWALRRWTRLEVRDYTNLLHLMDEYQVVELGVEPGDWLANKKLVELDLRHEGVIVLGIHRANGEYVGAPHGQTRIYEEDTLLLYGRESGLEELDYRPDTPRGDRAHKQAVAEQENVVHEQNKREAQREQEEQ
jgi:hypothetical protein